MAKLFSSFCLAALFVGSLVAAPVLELDPVGGSISGAPGDTIGWGFTITNDTTFYLTVTEVTPSGFTFVPGTFADYVLSLNFYVVAPNSSLPVAFDAGTTQGFGEYAIQAGASPGTDSGTFAVSYSLYVNDPSDPFWTPDPLDSPDEFFDPVAASVNVVEDVVVPEPSTLLLLGAGLAMLLGRRLRA